MSSLPSPGWKVQPNLVQLLPQGPASIFRLGSVHKKAWWLFKRQHFKPPKFPACHQNRNGSETVYILWTIIK